MTGVMPAARLLVTGSGARLAAELWVVDYYPRIIGKFKEKVRFFKPVPGRFVIIMSNYMIFQDILSIK